MKYYRHVVTGKVISAEKEVNKDWNEIDKKQYEELLLDDLKSRVQQFNSLSLPGQGMSTHLGTAYLVNDLWREVQRLRAQGFQISITCPNCGTFVGVDFGK